MKQLGMVLSGMLLAGCAVEVHTTWTEHALSEPDVIDTWNAITDAYVIRASGAPTRAEYHFALVHAAMYDATVAITKSHAPLVSAVDASADASTAAAIAQAAHDALRGTLVGPSPMHLTDAQRADLASQLAASLALVPDGPAKDAGIEVGQAAAAAIVAMYERSGYLQDEPGYYVPGTAGAGTWIPISGRGVAPWIGHVTPLVMDPDDFFRKQFKLPGPPALTSVRYAADYNETLAIGQRESTLRTPEQTNIGWFWAENTPRIWNRALVTIANNEGLDQLEKVRLYAQAHTAGSDATLACWAVKYDAQFWRPMTAVRTTFDDGNPATATNASWTPLFNTSPNHPEYPSGHACFTGAFTRSIEHFLGTGDVTFTVESRGANVTTKRITYTSLGDAVDDVNDSRVFLGIHFRSAQDDGTQLGERVGQFVASKIFGR